MRQAKVAVVASWDGWCGDCAAERPLVLTRAGRRTLRGWLSGADDDDLPLTLTCRICGVGAFVPAREEDDVEDAVVEAPERDIPAVAGAQDVAAVSVVVPADAGAAVGPGVTSVQAQGSAVTEPAVAAEAVALLTLVDGAARTEVGPDAPDVLAAEAAAPAQAPATAPAPALPAPAEPAAPPALAEPISKPISPAMAAGLHRARQRLVDALTAEAARRAVAAVADVPADGVPSEPAGDDGRAASGPVPAHLHATVPAARDGAHELHSDEAMLDLLAEGVDVHRS